jgi:hypothetical protein
MEGEKMRSIHAMQNSAVAGVIEALLLVGLVAIVISMIQLVYIPQVMEQREADHMDGVFNQMSSLKAMVDMEGMTQSYSPISSMVTLGSPRLPYFLTAPAYGRLSYYEAATTRIVFNPAPFIGGIFLINQTISSIRYLGENSYFVDQEYILEGGGIIMKQANGAPVMIADPLISPDNKSSFILHITLPIFIEKGGKGQAEGDGKCFVRTNFSSSQVYNESSFGTDMGVIKLYSDYAVAWNQSLHNLLGPYLHKYVEVSLSPSHEYVQIQALSTGGKQVGLSVKVIKIFVQIGPGYVG